MEHTIARMCAPPQEPPIERSHNAMPSIPIQNMSIGTMDGALARPSGTATSALVGPEMYELED